GEAGQTALISLLRALGLAVAGGLVLNLMPCVLPVLSVKGLGLVQHSSGRLWPLRAHGLAYTAGMLASFAVVAGALIGQRAGAGHRLTGHSGYAGSFATGALATVAATPCTAPIMGTAVGFAITQPWPTALFVFEALGLGLALPYLLLTLVPAWSRFLPKPGPW